MLLMPFLPLPVPPSTGTVTVVAIDDANRHGSATGEIGTDYGGALPFSYYEAWCEWH